MDLEHEKKIITEFANVLHDHGRDTVGSKRTEFNAMNKKIRGMVHELLKGDELGVSSYDATFAFLAMAAINSMTVMDSFVRPDHCYDVPKEIRDDWSKIESDWRMTTIIHVFTAMCIGIRESQMATNSLPLDMMETEGRG